MSLDRATRSDSGANALAIELDAALARLGEKTMTMVVPAHNKTGARKPHYVALQFDASFVRFVTEAVQQPGMPASARLFALDGPFADFHGEVRTHWGGYDEREAEWGDPTVAKGAALVEIQASRWVLRQDVRWFEHDFLSSDSVDLAAFLRMVATHTHTDADADVPYRDRVATLPSLVNAPELSAFLELADHEDREDRFGRQQAEKWRLVRERITEQEQRAAQGLTSPSSSLFGGLSGEGSGEEEEHVSRPRG